MHSKIFIIFLTFLSVSACSQKNKIQPFEKTGKILKIESTIALSDVKGRIDHLDIDIVGQKLFIAALGNNSVEVVDLVKGKVIYSIKDIEEPQGVVFIPGNMLCVSSGGTGECIFYNSNTFEKISTLKIGSDADNLRYDSERKLVYAGYGNGGIAVMDAVKFSVLSSIKLSGHPESFQIDKIKGKMYVNVPDNRNVEVCDIQNQTVIRSLTIKDAEANYPMAVDEGNGRLFIGCRKPSVLIIIYTESLTEIARLEIKKDVDDIYYDSQRKLIYLTCGEGYIQVISQENKGDYKIAETLETSTGARTSLFVPELKKIYVTVPKNNFENAALLVYNVTD